VALKGLLGKLVGDANERTIARLQKVVEQINALEPEFRALDDGQLRAKTDGFRRRLARGESLDDVLVEAFAAVREAARRTIGLRHYDVQLIGGMVLHQGKIAEMKTGEGKTLVATLPLYLNGLTLNPEWVERARARWGDDPDRWEFTPLDGVPVGRGVHLVTVNDYLARRDGGWMGPIYHALGLRVGLVIPGFSAVYDPDYVAQQALLEDDRLVHWRPVPRQEAYAADITYGTNNEFGFDYLRDNLVTDLSDCVQRELYYAIIDEVDSVLIDEARTPLIISGPAEVPSDLYRRFDQIVRRLKRDVDYEVDERTRVVTLTEAGIDKVESMLPEIKPGESIYDAKHAHMLPYLDNALHAHVIYQRDKDYVVKDGQVVIVDEFTGRLLYGRRYSEGLHQAIEAKEGLAIQRESLTYGTITVQNYFRMYRKLAGMTGTAATEKEEFYTIYGLDVVVLPTNVEYRARYGDLTERHRRVSELEEVQFAGVVEDGRDVVVTTYEWGDPPQERYYRRLDLPDVIYVDEATKFKAIIDEVERLHRAGRPVLVGTIAVETSERLSRLLKKRGIPHSVLNAKRHQQEAAVIAQAGRPGAVTIATNMAGRGVDIVLGGEPEGLAAQEVRRLLEQRLPVALGRVAGGDGKGKGRVSQETSQAVQVLSEEFAAYEAAKAEGGSALPRFLAERLIAEGGVAPRYRGEAVRLARYVLEGAWDKAGQLAQEAEGLSLDTLSHLQRIRERFEKAGDAEHYVAYTLSSTYHNLVMAVIRRVLEGDEEGAQELLTRYPELPPEVIERVKEIREMCRRDRERVRSLGGLHVIGTERHEARRIDNQLRGRAGRQGDPGSSRFYISLEDELMRRFGGERVQNLMRQVGAEDMPLESGMFSKLVESAQTRVEGYNFDVRKHVLEYDDVINKQREVIYAQRREVLEARDLRDQILRMFQEEIEELLNTYCTGYGAEDWDVDGLHKELRTFLPALPAIPVEQWREVPLERLREELFRSAEVAYDLHYRSLGRRLYEEARKRDETLAGLRAAGDHLHRLVYQRIVEHLGGEPDEETLDRPLRRLPEELRAKVEAGFVDGTRIYYDRQTILRAVDGLWVRHLTDLAVLREGIGLRAFGKEDPLVAFRREAYEMYQSLLGQIRTRVVHTLFRAPFTIPIGRPRRRMQAGRPGVPAARVAGAPAAGTATPPAKRPGRNDPCWCGSGKKYKHCHMREDMAAERTSVVHTRPPQTPRRRRRR
jgi:preprotein translocase subunit SecA